MGGCHFLYNVVMKFYPSLLIKAFENSCYMGGGVDDKFDFVGGGALK